MPYKNEIGRIGQYRYDSYGNGSIFMEEFLTELQGVRGVQAYTEMAENDATIGGVLFAIEMLMRNCELHIEPGGESAKDQEAAEFVDSCMHDMERTWSDTFSEIISFLAYGWSYHEIVYKRRVGKTSSPVTNSRYSDGLIGWRKLPIRSQDSLYAWEYKDESDDLTGMTQAPYPGTAHYTIPIEKALHFRTRSRKDNPEGRSILRTAYRAYYMKKRIEEIEGYGMERDLAGFPVLEAPDGMDIWNPYDEEMQRTLAYAEELVSSIRRDAREGLVIPGGENGWKFSLLASSGKRQFDTNATIERWDKRIATSVLADFIMLGQQQVGSFALADSKTKIFALAIGSYMDVICEVFNTQAIPRLIDANGDHFKGITDYPKMVHGDIEDQDITAMAAYITAMVGAGVLTPDEELEKEIRRIGHLPEKLETDTPEGEAPYENPKEESMESQTVYKVTSLLDKYQSGKMTRESTAALLANIGLDEEKINFHLNEADKVRADLEKRKQEETPVDDEEDARKAQEAKKSLGRE